MTINSSCQVPRFTYPVIVKPSENKEFFSCKPLPKPILEYYTSRRVHAFTKKTSHTNCSSFCQLIFWWGFFVLTLFWIQVKKHQWSLFVIRNFEVARETVPRWLSKCIVGLFWGTNLPPCWNMSPTTVPQCTLTTISNRSPQPQSGNEIAW